MMEPVVRPSQDRVITAPPRPIWNPDTETWELQPSAQSCVTVTICQQQWQQMLEVWHAYRNTQPRNTAEQSAWQQFIFTRKLSQP